MVRQHWFIDCKDSKRLIRMLNAFFMAHQELSKELLGAKPLGICKTTGLVGPNINFKSLDSMPENGNVTMPIDTILTNEKSKEIM